MTLIDATNDHRNRGGRVLRKFCAVKLIYLLSAVALTACAHPTEAVTFEHLQRASVPALCEHDPGQLRRAELPPQEEHRGEVKIALNDSTGAYRVAFGDLTGGGGDAAMVIHCNAGGVGWPETVELYTPGPQLEKDGPRLLGGIDLGDLSHGGRESVTDLSIADGVAHVTWMTTGPHDALCCATVAMAADLRWDGSTVVAQNVRRVN